MQTLNYAIEVCPMVLNKSVPVDGILYYVVMEFPINIQLYVIKTLSSLHGCISGPVL